MRWIDGGEHQRAAGWQADGMRCADRRDAKRLAYRLGSAAGGGTGLAGLVKPIIALHALGRMQAARPLQPVLGRFSTATVQVASD
jgi:hypothetical protein